MRVKYGGTTLFYGLITINIFPNAYPLLLRGYLSGTPSPTAQRGGGILHIGPPGNVGNPPGGSYASYANILAVNTTMTVNSSIAQPLIITFAWASASATASAKLQTVHVTRGA